MLAPVTFAFLVLGAMMPYWFTAMTMKSVGEAAKEMVIEVKRQFDELDLLNVNSSAQPDYARCIAISTEASLREMVPPGILVIFTPIAVGALFGVEAVSGLLAGSLVSSLQLAISASNTGGAWDNAKKYVEKGMVRMEVRQADGSLRLMVQGKGSDCHKAAVVGDTVGDPLKDTSGPALNIVMKLQAIISLVFCGFFLSINHGRGIFNVATTQ
jgi:inorganic pyrophosphatase